MSLFADFPPVSTAEWLAAIQRDLKGKSPEGLNWQAEDGIVVKPFFRTEDLAGIQTGGAAPRGWRARCAITGDIPEGRRQIADALERGVEALSFYRMSIATRGDLTELLRDVPLNKVSLHFADPSPLEWLTTLPGIEKSTGSFAACGAGFAEHYQMVRAALPNWIPFFPDTSADTGSSAVEELGVMLATAAEYFVSLSDGGVEIADAAAHFGFALEIGSNYFFEIAKLRAARRLWPMVIRAFDPAAAAPVRIHARTSAWDQTLYDPHVNLLRTTTQAMAAVIGGCDWLTIRPFDSRHPVDRELSRRLALNVHLLLRHEAYFDKVADPAAGSWYIEWLTDRIARGAWKMFQEIEVQGGLMQTAWSGWLQQRLAAGRDARMTAIEERSRALVGVNQYANPEERLQGIESAQPAGAAAAYEELRLAANRWSSRTGKTPLVFVLRLGDPKIALARAEFTRSLFACGGFEAVDGGILEIPKSGAQIVVLCSSDHEYPPLLLRVRGFVPPDVPLLIAGYPKDEVGALRAAGVAGFVHLKSNPVQTLAEWQRHVGIR